MLLRKLKRSSATLLDIRCHVQNRRRITGMPNPEFPKKMLGGKPYKPEQAMLDANVNGKS